MTAYHIISYISFYHITIFPLRSRRAARAHHVIQSKRVNSSSSAKSRWLLTGWVSPMLLHLLISRQHLSFFFLPFKPFFPIRTLPAFMALKSRQLDIVIYYSYLYSIRIHPNRARLLLTLTFLSHGYKGPAADIIMAVHLILLITYLPSPPSSSISFFVFFPNFILSFSFSFQKVNANSLMYSMTRVFSSFSSSYTSYIPSLRLWNDNAPT